MASVLLQIGLVYFLGHLFAYGFRKFRIPDILLFTIVGVLLGPVFNVAKPENFGTVGAVLSTLALIVILFESGTTLNFRKAAQASGLSLILTLSTMIATTAVIFLFTLPFTKSAPISLLIGVTSSGTSSAVVIPMLAALGITEKLKNVLIMESSLTDVLCIVLTLTLSQSFLQGAFSIKAFLEQILLSFLVAIAIGAIGGLLWAKFRHILKAQFATIAVALVVYGITEIVGYSGPIAVMSMGILLTQAPHLLKNTQIAPLSELEANFYSELVFILKVFFFIFLGISINVKSVSTVLLTIAIMSIVFFVRFFLVRIFARNAGTATELTFTSLLIPKGLAAAVLAGVPLQMGLEQGEEIQNFVYTIVLVSIVVVSTLIPISQINFLKRFFEIFFKKPQDSSSPNGAD